MSKKQDRSWFCHKVIKKLHSVSEREFNERLAEVWDLLFNNQSQITKNFQAPSITLTKSFVPKVNFLTRRGKG